MTSSVPGSNFAFVSSVNLDDLKDHNLLKGPFNKSPVLFPRFSLSTE